MSCSHRTSLLEMTRARFGAIVEKEDMLDVETSVLVKTLTAAEAIGTPGRRDFPIIIGKERVVESMVREAKGHAFTDSPREFVGTLKELLNLELVTNENRVIFVATLNAVLRHLEMVDATVHCKNDDPETCAREIAKHILQKHGRIHVGLIGLNPAIAERFADTFGADRVLITDLDCDNIGKRRFGVEIWNGIDRTTDLIEASDVIVLTGTTLVNGTFDFIWNRIQDLQKEYLVYGVTASGVSKLMGIDRICPCGRNA